MRHGTIVPNMGLQEGTVETTTRGGREMADDQTLQGSNTQKDPDEWVTKDEPMTGAQASYLKTLSQEANESFDENMTKAEASKKIDELQEKTGRGQP